MDEPGQDPDLDLDLTTELVRAYVITNGRGLPSDNVFSRMTLVTATEQASGSRILTPEARKVVELLAGRVRPVVEVAARTRLPLGVVRILLTELEDAGLISARPPVPRAEKIDRELLTDVLNGLKARFGA
ncbi:DUF742 domain-containing protein [Streptomyces sp.]|uniref:DUF742 domain-containing protein n=1 Tax=Streptomyces sp. TaxID=1931 RepID=UPI002F425607